MTDKTVDTGTDESNDSLVTLRRSEIKVLQKKAKERDEFAEQLAEAKDATRRLAFAEAGIPLGDKRAAYFIKGYDGDLEPDAIRAAAQEIGLVDEEAGQQQSGQTTVDGQVEQQALQAIYSASQGAGTQPPTDVDASLEQAYAEGGTEGLMQFLASQGVPISED